MHGKIIFLSQNPKDAEFCQEIGRKLNMEVVAVGRAEGLMDSLIENRQSVVFLQSDHEGSDYPASPFYLQSLVEKALCYLPPSRLFSLSEKSVFSSPKLNRTSSIATYCQRNYDSFAMDWVCKIVTSSLDTEIEALTHFKDGDAKELKIKLTHSQDKSKALLGFEKLLLAKKMNERAVQVVLQAVDELIMNALFDAPLDEKQRPYRKTEERDTDFFLFDREEIDLGIILNEETVVIHVTDHFGSLSREKAIALIQKDYTKSEYKTDAFVKSAGLGLHGVVGSGLGLFIEVAPKVSTQAILAFPIFKNFKSMRNSFRSFTLRVKD
jgi:hypothetical protein